MPRGLPRDAQLGCSPLALLVSWFGAHFLARGPGAWKSGTRRVGQGNYVPRPAPEAGGTFSPAHSAFM